MKIRRLYKRHEGRYGDLCITVALGNVKEKVIINHKTVHRRQPPAKPSFQVANKVRCVNLDFD